MFWLETKCGMSRFYRMYYGGMGEDTTPTHSVCVDTHRLFSTESRQVGTVSTRCASNKILKTVKK